MKTRVLSQVISLFLLVLMVAMLGGCGAVQKVDQIEDQVEQKTDQVEDQLENAVTPSTSGNTTATLTLAEAQEIALNHAGFTADQVTGLTGHYELDDGVPEYEVEFYLDGWEYDYTIHADTGEIREFDKDNH